jgi:hypothetical protein
MGKNMTINSNDTEYAMPKLATNIITNSELIAEEIPKDITKKDSKKQRNTVSNAVNNELLDIPGAVAIRKKRKMNN